MAVPGKPRNPDAHYRPGMRLGNMQMQTWIPPYKSLTDEVTSLMSYSEATLRMQTQSNISVRRKERLHSAW